MSEAYQEVIKCCGSCDYSREDKELERTQVRCEPFKKVVPVNFKCGIYIQKVKPRLLITCGKCGQMMIKDAVSELERKAELCEDCLEQTPLSVLNAIE